MKFTIADNSNFDKRCLDAHFVPFLFYHYCKPLMGILQKLHSSRNKLSTTMAGKYFSSKAIIILKKLGKLQQDKVHIFSKGYKSFMEF